MASSPRNVSISALPGLAARASSAACRAAWPSPAWRRSRAWASRCAASPVALIAKANNVQGANIRVGETLRLIDGNAHVFALAVSKSRNDLVVTLDGQFFKRYRVSTGENAKTPVGTFKIVDKIAQPAWHKPGGKAIPYGDPENLLGTHWLALDLPGYGLHGTWEPDSIGKQTSAGCVRLLNGDIEELYTILPKGTLVTITE